MIESPIKFSSESESMPGSVPGSMALDTVVCVDKPELLFLMGEPPPQTEARYDEYNIFVSYIKAAKLLALTGQSPFEEFAERWPSRTVEWLCREVASRSEEAIGTGTRLLWEEIRVPLPYHKRLTELRKYALEEEIILDDESRSDFIDFIRMADFPLREGALFLLRNGTHRVMWRDDHWRLSIRFRGDGKIDYVLLDRTNPPDGETGTVDLKDFGDLRRRLGLESLLSG